MAKKIDELKRLIADTLKINASDIDDGFSLKTGRFKTSAGSVILNNIFRKVFGQKVDCRKVNTFGELLTLAGENSDQSTVVSSVEPEPKVSNTAVVKSVEAPEHHESEERNEQQEKVESVNTEAELGRIVCGIDIQEIETFPDVADFWTDSFYIDNFTNEEIAYCVTTASPRNSFVGRWCAKEALKKCVAKYSELPFHDIQIGKKASGKLKIEIKNADNNTWLELIELSCSISHADKYAVGMVTGMTTESED